VGRIQIHLTLLAGLFALFVSTPSVRAQMGNSGSPHYPYDYSYSYRYPYGYSQGYGYGQGYPYDYAYGGGYGHPYDYANPSGLAGEVTSPLGTGQGR